jgi:hypothetical protein
MDDSTLLYGLLIATTINTILLLLLVAVLIRLSLTLNSLIQRLEGFIEMGQKEIINTMAVARGALRQGGNFMGKAALVAERYLVLSGLKRLSSSSPRLAKIISGVSLGYSVAQPLMKSWQKNSKQL